MKRIVFRFVTSAALVLSCLLAPAVVAPSVATQANAGQIIIRHVWMNNQWWTVTYYYEFPGYWIILSMTPGYF